MSKGSLIALIIVLGDEVMKKSLLLKRLNRKELNDQLEHKVLERTAELAAANEMLNAQSEELTAMNAELTAMNEELTAMNEEVSAVNESLLNANQKLDTEIVFRKQKEQEILSREKQYRATTALVMHLDEDYDALLEIILKNAIQLVGAPGGHIGLKEDGKNYSIRHTAGNYPAKHLLRRSVDQGMLGEVFASGEPVYTEDYRHYPHRVQDENFDRLRTVVMIPLKREHEVMGVLAADWTDEVHLVTEEDLDILRQFAVLASIAMERAHVKQQITYRNELLKKLAETTALLVNELDLEKTLQNILEQATAFMEIPHGFISFFEPDRRQARIKCGLGRYESRVGTVTRFGEKGIYAEILRTGKMVVVDDYAKWPQRLEGTFTTEMTASMQAPLNVDGRTVASIGLAAYGEPFKIDPTKLALFEQFAAIATIAVKNAMTHQKTHHQALHDTLTSLPNRAFLNNRLEEELQKTRCRRGVGAVLYIDLDDLKTVNDSFGHSCGDGVIKAAANQIAETVGPEAFVARVGGDEFIVILSGEDDLKNIAQIANRLVSVSHREYAVGGRNIHMSVSVGVTLYPGDGEIAEDLLKNADSAMYAAKAAGRNCWRFFEPEMVRDAYGKWSLTQSLRHALERGELYLHYQPLIKLDRMEIIGYEALLRWNNPEHGRVPPNRFIPLAEQSGLILPIGDWVIGEACRFARGLAAMGRENVHVAVNISPRQLAVEDFAGRVRRALDETGIQPKQLEVEITENVLIDSLEDSVRKLGELNAMGVGLSLDDFGTGFSSLTYLRSLPVHTLKIDKSFIDGIMEDKVQEDFVRSIIDMAHAIGLNVIAEGVESEGQLQKLTLFGCDCVQGYIFSKPIPGEEALRFSI